MAVNQVYRSGAISGRSEEGREVVFLANCEVTGKFRNVEVTCVSCEGVFKAHELDTSCVLCEECYDDAGAENAHADGRCEAECRFCAEEDQEGHAEACYFDQCAAWTEGLAG